MPAQSGSLLATRRGRLLLLLLCAPEQSVDEALTLLQDNQVTALTRPDMSEAFQGMKAAVVEMIQARMAASQPGALSAPRWRRHGPHGLHLHRGPAVPWRPAAAP